MAQNGYGDDLIKDGNENLGERVEKLEKKSHDQEDEIMCLKAALADAIRRIKTLEAADSHTPAKPSRPGATKRLALSSARQSSNNDTSRGPPSPAHSRPPSKSTSKPPKPVRASSEVALSTSGSGSAKPPTWNAESAYLKIYLKGRPIFLYAPSCHADYTPTAETPPPNSKLQLEWVYGYRGRDCRSNIYYLPTGEMVYFVAATAILFNPDEKTQRLYTGHNDDIKCLAIHPDRVHIATGQVAGHDKKDGRPHVRIWHSVSLNTVHVIGFGEFERAVSCISFSKLDKGKHMVAVDESNDHNISVWDVSADKPTKLTVTKSSQDPVLAVEFHPQENNCIVSCGKNHIAFWNFDGSTLNKKMGLFDKYKKPTYMLCLTFNDDGEVISGDSNGNIFVWKRTGNSITRAILEAHEGGVFSLLVTPDGKLLSGGGKDRKIIEWDADLKKTGLETEMLETYGGVRVLTLRRGNMILVGSTKNYILQGQADFSLNPIVFGHTDELWGLAMHPTHHQFLTYRYDNMLRGQEAMINGQKSMGHTDELWGLAMHPTHHQFLTCGYDKHVFMWDALSHTVVWGTELTDPAHSCCFHPKQNMAAIGLQTGTWLVLDLTARDVIDNHTDGNEQIEVVQYSPDGKYLAVGSRDNFIYVYKVNDDATQYTRSGKCSGHSSFITHLDWSTDSAYIRSNSGDYELLYWTAEDCKQEASLADMKDVEWAAQSCTLDFTVAGIWPHGADGTDINACARSNKQMLVATADDFGKVNLYSYPCTQPKATANSYRGHSSHVTNVVFTPDDSRIITTGGKDTAVLQWVLS